MNKNQPEPNAQPLVDAGFTCGDSHWFNSADGKWSVSVPFDSSIIPTPENPNDKWGLWSFVDNGENESGWDELTPSFDTIEELLKCFDLHFRVDGEGPFLLAEILATNVGADALDEQDLQALLQMGIGDMYAVGQTLLECVPKG